MKLSVIMPAYNEEKTIEEIIKKVLKVPLNIELIVVDDGSKDKTRQIIEKFRSNNNVKIIFQKNNQGKGAAIRVGIKKATGDMIIIQDADLELDPKDYLKLIQPIIKNKSKVVYGSRFINKPKSKKQGLSFYLGSQFLTTLTNILYNAHITDEATCYKLFSSEVIKKINLKCNGFEFCPEVTAKVRKLGLKIVEIPIFYKPRNIKQGKKIRLKDGFLAAWTLIKYRFID